MKKNNTWNFRHLDDESFVPENQRTSVLYCRLSDFWIPDAARPQAPWFWFSRKTFLPHFLPHIDT